MLSCTETLYDSIHDTQNDALFEYVKRGGYCEVNDGYEFNYNRIR